MTLHMTAGPTDVTYRDMVNFKKISTFSTKYIVLVEHQSELVMRFLKSPAFDCWMKSREMKEAIFVIDAVTQGFQTSQDIIFSSSFSAVGHLKVCIFV